MRAHPAPWACPESPHVEEVVDGFHRAGVPVTLLSVALALVSLLIIVILVVLSLRKVPTVLSQARPHSETPNRQRVVASLARIVPSSQRVRFDAAAYPDLPMFMRAALALCSPESARFVAEHTAEGQQESHSVRIEKHTFRATVPAIVGLDSAEPLLKLINQALTVTRSARRVALLFDQQNHWFAVLEPGFAARLQRVGVQVAPPMS